VNQVRNKLISIVKAAADTLFCLYFGVLQMFYFKLKFSAPALNIFLFLAKK
jgi:hypothetical protein